MQIVIGAFGEHLSDSVFMKRQPQTTLMEFFPSGVFTRDWELVIRSMGIRYIAWQGEQYVFIHPASPSIHDLTCFVFRCRKYTGESLPSVSRPSGPQEVHIDAAVVVRAVKEELSRRV